MSRKVFVVFKCCMVISDMDVFCLRSSVHEHLSVLSAKANPMHIYSNRCSINRELRSALTSDFISLATNQNCMRQARQRSKFFQLVNSERWLAVDKTSVESPLRTSNTQDLGLSYTKRKPLVLYCDMQGGYVVKRNPRLVVRTMILGRLSNELQIVPTVSFRIGRMISRT
jgi:hypothetical protein